MKESELFDDGITEENPEDVKEMAKLLLRERWIKKYQDSLAFQAKAKELNKRFFG